MAEWFVDDVKGQPWVELAKKQYSDTPKGPFHPDKDSTID